MHNAGYTATLERAGAPGLDRFAAYVWGRAAPMGQPTAAVVAAAVGVFEPAMLTAGYERGRRAVGGEALLKARVDATADSLRGVLGDIDVSPCGDGLTAGR